ncbi:MAG: hypothetical protein JWO63_1882, partial [Frankiales bacterium]|nr:hypothetical protein [Frankiales bacterium]
LDPRQLSELTSRSADQLNAANLVLADAVGVAPPG